MKSLQYPYSTLALSIAALAILTLVISHPRYERSHTEAPLAWDVSGYYLYLPAIIIHKDLKELKFLPKVIETYRPSPVADQAFEYGVDANGNPRQVMKYPVGMALLYLPFFLLAHLIALFSKFEADGFSFPYQAAIQLGSVFVALLGLWFTRKNLLRFFDDKVSAATLLLIALGTNFFNYATFDAAMPHIYLFALFALLLHFTIRWHEKPNWANSFGIGVCIGLSALVRPTEVIIAIVPLLFGVASFNSLREKIGQLWSNLPKLLVAGGLVALIGFIQLAYWKYVAGEWLVYSYEEQGFSFFNPHFANVFFSFRKGWFVYTPLMAFAVLGFFFAFRQKQRFLLPVFLFFLINTWIVSSWDIWWYGGSFGQRAMIQSYAFLALPLAAMLTSISRRLWLVWASFPVFGFCILLNLFQTYQAHWGPFESDMMTKAYYLRIFGKIENNPYDRFLIDTNELFDEKRENFSEVFATEFEEEPDTSGLSTQHAVSGRFTLYVDEQRPVSPEVNIPLTPEMKPGRWLHISGTYFSNRKEWEIWWMPQTVIVFQNEGRVIKEKYFRPFHVLKPGEWVELGLDVKIPADTFDKIKVFMRCPRSGSELYMDNLRVGAFGK